MTIPTILTQGATTHLKDGLPVTTVSNLGAMTPASEALIMSIKDTADKALAAAEGGGGGGGSQEDIDELKNRVTTVETKTDQNTTKITSLDAQQIALSKRVDGHDTEIDALKEADTEQNAKITSVESSVNSVKSDVAANTADIAKVDSRVSGLETTVDALKQDIDSTVGLLDTSVITDAQLEQQATGEYKLSTSAINLKTQDASSASFLIDLADENKSGLMPKESYKQLDDVSKVVESLSQGGVWRGTYDTYQELLAAYPGLDVSATNWTINDFVEVENDSEHEGNATRYIVQEVDGKKELVFQKVITAKIEQATSENLGVVKGSENIDENNKYKVFVEQDGTMSLIGGAKLDKSIVDLDSKIDDTKTNLENSINTLESKHDQDITDLTSKIDTDVKAVNDRIDEVEYKALPYNSFVGKPLSKYTFCEYDGLIFQAVADIVEVPEIFDSTQWKQIGGRDMELDGVTINKNADDELQAIGYIEKNTGAPEYQWTGTYADWVDGRNNGTIPDEWICKITDDYNADDNHKTFRSVLELWWSYSTDDYQDGAYCADGREFYKSDFKSEDESSNPYNKIVEQGRGITYEQYQQTLDTYGFCGAFAIDTVNEKFRLPTIKNCYIRAGESIGATIDQSLPNIIGSVNILADTPNTIAAGSLYIDNTQASSDNRRIDSVTSSSNKGLHIDASRSSSAYKDGADVLPYSVVLKPMIQLINYIPKNVSIEFITNTEREIQSLKATVNTLSTKLVEVSNSFIPDYSRKTEITSGYVTQEKGAFQLNCNSYSSTPHVYFDGVEVWTGCLYSNERMQSNCFLTVKKGVAITWSADNTSSLNAYFIPFETQPTFDAE